MEFAVAGLPAEPVDAAAQFYVRALPAIREGLREASDAVILFEPADHAHRAWRLAAVQALAREAAPKRVNAIVGGKGAAKRDTLAFLARSPGITGQLLVVDGKSGEKD